MKTEQIIILVVAFFLGMLLLNMVKNVCGCDVVEGLQNLTDPSDAAAFGTLAEWERNCLNTRIASSCTPNRYRDFCNANENCMNDINNLSASRRWQRGTGCIAPDNTLEEGTTLSQHLYNAARTSLACGADDGGGGSPPTPPPPPCNEQQTEQIKHNCLTPSTDLSTKAGELSCTLPQDVVCTDDDVSTAITKVFNGTCLDFAAETPCGDDIQIEDGMYQCPYLTENPNEDASICTEITRTVCNIKGTMNSCEGGSTCVTGSDGGECQMNPPQWEVSPAARDDYSTALTTIFMNNINGLPLTNGLTLQQIELLKEKYAAGKKLGFIADGANLDGSQCILFNSSEAVSLGSIENAVAYCELDGACSTEPEWN